MNFFEPVMQSPGFTGGDKMKLVRWTMAAALAAGMAFFVSSCNDSDSGLEKDLKKAGKEVKAGMKKAGKEIEAGAEKAEKKVKSLGD